MTYEIYTYIFIGGAVLTAIMLLVSVALFFILRIPTVIGDLSGATARKAIDSIRKENANSGDKTYKSSRVNKERGKLTDKITPSGRLIKNPSASIGGAMATSKIGKQEFPATETTLLTDAPEVGNETTVLYSVAATMGETDVLSEPQNETIFEIEYEITFIHTDEVIV